MIPTTQLSTTRVSATSETFIVPSDKTQSDILKALLALDLSTERQRETRVTVRVSGKQFILARRDSFPNPFARSIFGVVNEASSGSLVDYNFSMKPAVRILFSMWFALMSVVLITGVTAIMTSGITEFRLELVALAVLFLGTASGIVALCLIASRKGERELEVVLQSIIGETPKVESK